VGEIEFARHSERLPTGGNNMNRGSDWDRAWKFRFFITDDNVNDAASVRKALRLLLSVGLLVCCCAAHASPVHESTETPNVVLVIADDMGFGDYGFMGHRQIRTPSLDRLARESVTFRRGYVTSSLCSPSLASILTGRYPHQHKITSNDPPLPRGVTAAAAAGDPAFLASRREMISYFDQMPTLPRTLAARRYVSFQAGKWWGGSFERGGFTHGMTHGDPARGGRHGDLGLAIGRQVMQPVFEFIEMAQARAGPFFLWFAPMMPHSPHSPPERLLAKYREKAGSLEIARYWGMCEWFDETCGQLLDFIERRKLAQDTLVIFLADNGWIQDPAADRFAPRSKQSPYDGGLRTPILVRWPGKAAPRTCDVPVSAIDIAATIRKSAGLGANAGTDGVNLLDAQAVAARPAIFGEIFTHNAVDIRDPSSSLRFRWVVAGDWKLIVPDRRNEPAAVVELFDLAHDPGENRNLARERPEKVHDLSIRLDSWWSGRG
jgi:arylsulfatase A-like enzyme